MLLKIVMALGPIALCGDCYWVSATSFAAASAARAAADAALAAATAASAAARAFAMAAARAGLILALGDFRAEGVTDPVAMSAPFRRAKRFGRLDFDDVDSRLPMTALRNGGLRR